MKIGIIGAGFTGLSAANELSKVGVEVTVFEKDSKPGGLAIGFKEKNWKWTIEKHYHHWFTSDENIKGLAGEIDAKLIFKRAKTSTLYKGKIYQLDSPLNLLKFPHISFLERVRTGLVIAYLRYIGTWEALEGFRAEKFLKATMGEQSWKVLWEPLFKAKFRKYAKEIPASWFWARIKKRSPSLGYPVGGYQAYVDLLAESIKESGKVKFIFDSDVTKIRKVKNEFIIETQGNKYKFDKVLSTLPFPFLAKLAPQLPETYTKNILGLKAIGAVNLLLSLKRQFLTDGTYWLNVNDKMPFLAVVEHTNFMDAKDYGGEKLLYVGNYLEHTHPYFSYTKEELFREFLPYLKKLNPDFKKNWVNKTYLFPAKFAQPIHPTNYSKTVPSFDTPLKGLFTANMQQIHPWDRGTEFAVEMGKKVTELMLSSK